MCRMDFQPRGKVYMMLNNDTVGIGCVCRIDPNSTCSGTMIGQGNVSLLVEECLKDVELPFPTMDTAYLRRALWSNVRWPKMLLRPFTNELEFGEQSEMCNDVNQEEPLEPPIVDAIPITSPEIDMQVRQSWKNKMVLLKDESLMQTVNQGIILYVFPFECVNFQQLGDDSVGVAIESANGVEIMPQLDSITLVKWPIKQVMMLDGSPLQRYVPLDNMHARHDNVSNEENDAHVTSEVNVAPASKKRRYTFINRAPKQRSQPTSNFYVSWESIQRVSCIDCCAKKCCQVIDRNVLLGIRQDFWGQSQESRTNYVYDVLSTTWHCDLASKVRYEFRLYGMIVCCRAWYEIHGIPKTSFYRYKEKFESGVCQYMHGNTGVLRRGLEHTSRARSLLDEFVNMNSEPAPHKSRTMLDGSRETRLSIPSVFKQVDILNEINTTLEQLGYEKKLSTSSFGRIWNKEYPQVSLTKASEFSKCTLCSALKAKLEAKPSLEERARLLNERGIHMQQQLSCRSLYYAWRTFSETQPAKYVCIIHDKMDQKKTAIPRLRVLPKGVDSGYSLPIALIGMITHGHAEGHYGHFTLNGLWPSDPNLTIGSIASCLHNLERMDKHPLGDLATNGLPRSNVPLLHALNSRTALDNHNMSDGKDPIVELGTHQGVDSATSFHNLPENLLLQLDNCAGENKNRYLFAYLSMHEVLSKLYSWDF